MKEIPIIISLNGNSTESDRDLFGLGEKVVDPEILKYVKSDNLRYVNKEAKIDDNVIISHDTKQKRVITESLDVGFVDYFYLLSIGMTDFGLAELTYKITNWLLEKTQKQDCKIVVNGKELKKRRH